MDKIFYYQKRLIQNPYSYYLFIVFASLLNAYMLNWLNEEINSESFSSLNKIVDNNSVTTFIIVSIVGPIIETYLFTVIIIEFIKGMEGSLKQKGYFLVSLISALLFALTHFYNLIYFIQAFVFCLILNITYIALRYKNYKSIIYSSIVISLIHSVVNVIIFIHNSYYL